MLFTIKVHNAHPSYQFYRSLISLTTRSTASKRLNLRRHYSSETARKVIFSGIQPTGVPHIGNYLGALRQWVRLQEDAEPSTQLLFSIVDLHAITLHQNAEELRQRKRETLAALLAIGLDPERVILFYQSEVCFYLFWSMPRAKRLSIPRWPLMQISCGF